MSTRIRRILVCGTNYGRTYMDAVARSDGRFELVGVLARGSERSRREAARRGCPLFTDAGELPAGIDIACGAMAASGRDAVLGLLRRGLPVLCEHPQPRAFVETALEAAASAGVPFHVNGHFADLPAPREWIERFQAARAQEPPAFLDVLVADRALYGVLDLLARGWGGLGAPLLIEPAGPARSGPFRDLRGEIAAVPVSLRVQVSGAGHGGVLADGSAGYFFDARVTAGFPSGVLTLLSLAGPVVWNRNSARGGDAPLWSAGDAEAPDVSRLHATRVAANLEALARLASVLDGGPVPEHQTPAALLDIAASWDRCSAALATGGR